MKQREHTVSNFKKQIKLNKKEVGAIAKCLINTRVGIFNRLHNSKHFINWTQIGKSNSYTWTIHENWNNVQLGLNF